MLPVATTITTPAPVQTLVSTALPENFAQRVPYTDVSPSVSSVQINNNARGNGSYTPVTSLAAYPVPVLEGEAATGATVSIASSKIPATFLAQIIGQGVPPAMQGALSNVLASYDQLVVNSFVKYKPSNATLPPPQPASVFGKFLAQEQTAPQPTQQQPQRVEAPPQPVQQVQATQPEAQVVVAQQAAAAPEIKQEKPVEKPASQPQAAAPKRAAVKVAIAYLMTEARVDMETPPALNAKI